MGFNVRSETAIQDSVEQSVKQFGGIDIVINNASAISLTGTQETPMKTYDLMHQVRTWWVGVIREITTLEPRIIIYPGNI